MFSVVLSCISRKEPALTRVAGQLGPWTTRPVDSSARSRQLGPYVPDNSARRFNYTECLSREQTNKIPVIYCLFEVILSYLWNKNLMFFIFFYFNFKWSHKIT